MEVESLLSCYGDELGMIEDMSVAVDDLRYVSLQFIEACDGDISPKITKGRFVQWQYFYLFFLAGCWFGFFFQVLKLFSVVVIISSEESYQLKLVSTLCD